MKKEEARAVLDQLRAYTIDVQKFLGLKPTGKSRNSNGRFKAPAPNGFIFHYTASNRAVSQKRKFGRLPVLLERFKPGGNQGVGVPFIAWDEPIPRLKSIKDGYPLIRDIPAEIYFMGDDEAFWHAGGNANNWALGIEIRNIGQVQKASNGNFFWSRGRYRYRGRTPIKIGSDHWEPYTWSQMVGCLWVLRLCAAVHDFRPERVLGHTQISSTRIDPGLHFPIHEMREYGLFNDLPLLKVPFLREFEDRNSEAFEDELVSEEAAHKGMYRHDWDGVDNEARIEAVHDYTKEEIIDLLSGSSASVSDVVEAKRDLRSCGYYIGENLGPDMTSEFLETLLLFQRRWKKRRTGGGYTQDMKVTGKLDEETKKRIEIFTRQMDRL